MLTMMSHPAQTQQSPEFLICLRAQVLSLLLQGLLRSRSGRFRTRLMTLGIAYLRFIIAML